MSFLKFTDLKGLMDPCKTNNLSAFDIRRISPDCYDLDAIERSLRLPVTRPKVDDGIHAAVDLFSDEDCNEEELEVLTILRECTKESSFKVVSELRLFEVLSKCYQRKKDIWLGETDDAVWSYGTSPDEFYLKWVKNINPCRLLSLWLTDVIGSAEEWEQVLEVSLHQVFAVEFDVDRQWYRGEVIGIVNDEVVQCLFIDYGRVERCYVDQLRKMPVELTRIPRFAFKCKLVNVDLTECIEGNVLLRFATCLKDSGKMQCRLVGLLKECAGFDVELRDEATNCHFSSVFVSSEKVDERCFVEPLLDHCPLEEESSLLIHGIGELKLAPSLPVPPKGYDCYSIEEAIDPGELYVWNQADPDEETVTRQQRKLNDFYSSPNWLDAYRIQTSRVFRNRPYAWFNEHRNCWERVMVVRTDMPPGQVFIQRIDFGSKIIVQIKDMMELSQRFCSWPPKVQLAHLVHIKPSMKAQHWNSQVCRKFRALVNLGKIHFGTIFSREGRNFNYTTADEQCKTWKSLGLLMVFANEKLPYSLQSLLVYLGLAEGTGVGAGHPFLPFVEQGCPKYKFSDQLNMCFSLNESDKVLSNRTIVETLKYPYSVVGNLEDLVSIGKIQPPNNNLHKDFLPQYLRVCLGWVKFTQVKSPSHFYVQMRHKESEFDRMIGDLSKCIEHDEMCADSIQPAMFVAVFFVYEEFSEFAITWSRAFILSVNAELRNAQVILIDYGIETLIKFDRIRELPAAFQDVLPYCRRAHLRLPDHVPTGSPKWSEDARCNFVSYVEKWSPGFPIYLAYQQNSSEGIVYLDVFEQELTYCFQRKDWVASSYLPKLKYQKLNKMKTNKVLQHLFCSVPLLINYEVASENDSFYTYQPIWDILIQNGFLIKSS